MSANPNDLAPALARARAGDRNAFDAVMRANGARLTGSAIALCRDADLAHDLTQETWLEAWKSLRHFDGRCAFTTWLHGILRHRFLKWLRRTRSRPALTLVQELPETADGAAPHPAGEAVRTEQAARLRAAVATLPDEQRQVLEMRFFADASLQDIAAALDCPEGTVKSRLHHALRTLREKKSNLFLPPGESSLSP